MRVSTSKGNSENAAEKDSPAIQNQRRRAHLCGNKRFERCAPMKIESMAPDEYGKKSASSIMGKQGIRRWQSLQIPES
jgi:hypothetical protein